MTTSMPSRVSRISQSFACNAARLKRQRISREYRATDAAHYHRNGTTFSHGQYFTVTKCVQLAGIRAPVPDVFGGPRTEFSPKCPVRPSLGGVAAVGELVRCINGAWMARPPQSCPRGIGCGRDHSIVCSVACSYGRHLTWRCGQCGAATYRPPLGPDCTLCRQGQRAEL